MSNSWDNKNKNNRPHAGLYSLICSNLNVLHMWQMGGVCIGLGFSSFPISFCFYSNLPSKPVAKEIQTQIIIHTFYLILNDFKMYSSLFWKFPILNSCQSCPYFSDVEWYTFYSLKKKKNILAFQFVSKNTIIPSWLVFPECKSVLNLI